MIKLSKEERVIGEAMATSFLDELQKIASGYGRDAEGEVGTKEVLLGAQMQLERGLEEAKQVGEPQSDRRAARVAGIARKLRKMEKTSAVSKIRYTKLFRHMMHERGITSPIQLTDAQKKKFFDQVDRAWKAKKESD